MGYAVYEDRAARDLGVERWAGYGVPAVCDVPDCSTRINRGMGYRCEEVWRSALDKETGEQIEWTEPGCELHFCSEHLEHGPGHGDEITPKPDIPEWMEHMLTDESWQEWRDENPDKTTWIRGELALAAEEGTNR